MKGRGERSESIVSVSIRNITPADLDIADTILVSAYEGGRSRRRDLQRGLGLQPEGWFLALLDGRPVGVGGALDYGPFASIGMMAVLPDARRRGVAARLLERILAWLDERGCPRAVLSATEAGTSLYRRYGFVDDGQTLVFRPQDDMPLPKPGVVLSPSVRVTTLHREELPELAAFDAPLFGADRAGLLAGYWADDSRRTLVAREANGSIAGYLVAQPRILGPWTATTEEAADALLMAALTLPFESGPIAIVGDSSAAIGVLPRHGLTHQGALLHMARGAAAMPGQPALVYGQASFALG